STRRAARRPGYVPGIVGRTVDRIVALPIGEHQRHISLAKQNGASFLQTLRSEGARLGHVVGKLGIAPGRRRAGDVIALLDGHRHAVERAHTSPFAKAASAAFARSRARPTSSQMTALSFGLYFSTRARKCSSASVARTLRSRMSRAISTAD